MAPSHPESHFEQVLAELGSLLPGAGEVSERYEKYRGGFVIPPVKLDSMFSRAVTESRARTARWVTLPEGGDFSVEYVTGKS